MGSISGIRAARPPPTCSQILKRGSFQSSEAEIWVQTQGSKYLNTEVVGPKDYTYNAFWDLIPSYVGAGTL